MRLILPMAIVVKSYLPLVKDVVGDCIAEVELLKDMPTHHFFIDRTWFPGLPVAMTVLSWNCRGLGNTLAIQVLRELGYNSQGGFYFSV